MGPAAPFGRAGPPTGSAPLRPPTGAARPQDPTEYADAATREDLRTPDDDVRALVRIAAHVTTADAGKDLFPPWT